MEYSREQLLEAKRQIDSTLHKLRATIQTFEGKEDAQRYKSQITLAKRRGDPAKIEECCWKGFDHEQEEGPWDGTCESALRLMASPHATLSRAVAIENERREYVCFAGMWWTPENHLAYMEPLCTVPQYRRKGLAAAALSELYRRMKPLGATHMTPLVISACPDIVRSPGSFHYGGLPFK